MKKKYSVPNIQVNKIGLAAMVCVSGVCGSGVSGEPGEDIDYGGVDGEGTKDPASRRFNEWGEEEEEEY